MTEIALAENKRARALDILGLVASLSALAVNIARNFQGIVDLADVSEFIVRNWERVTRAVRDLTWDAVDAVFDIKLSWVSARLVPTLIVLVSIVAFSMRRGVAGAIGRRLGIADRAPAVATVIAFVLFAAMVIFEQSYFSTTAADRPKGMSDAEAQYAEQYFAQCRRDFGLSDTSPLDAFCAFENAQSPVVKAAANFGPIDWLIIASYLGLLVYVVLRLQEEVFLAFVLAAGVVGLGYVVAGLRGGP